jgi:hypothetical protein
VGGSPEKGEIDLDACTADVFKNKKAIYPLICFLIESFSDPEFEG